MKLLSAACLAWLASSVSAESPVRSSHLRVTPRLPLGLYDRLLQQETTAAQSTPPTPFTSSSTDQLVFSGTPAPATLSERQRLASKFTAYTFDQKTSQDPSVPPVKGRETFKQRYWFDATYYKPGGPVIFLNGGETDAEVRLPFLETGIVKILMQATGGIGVIHEHRYYGQSWPVDSLATDDWRYLTTLQSLEDANYFAKNIVFPGLEHLKLTSDHAPWISYGGSYAGAQSAFLRAQFPEVWFGAIASSAVTKAITDYWEYYKPIQTNAPEACMAALTSNVELIDNALALDKPFITNALKSFFGLGGITRDVDFVNALSIPLGFWQARNWDPAASSTAFDDFCDALVAPPTAEDDSLSSIAALLPSSISKALSSLGRPTDPLKMLMSLSAYATYVRSNIAIACPATEEQDACFGTDDYSKSNDTIAGAQWKAWPYQVCTEWGYFQGAAPEGEPSIVSRLLNLEYTSAYCPLAFPPGEINQIPATPNVSIINQYGAFDVEASRLAFVDGSADPWIYATPHSPSNPAHNRPDSLNKPFKLIPNAVHHWDENGLADGSQEPEEIVSIHKDEVAFVKSWLKEWKK